MHLVYIPQNITKPLFPISPGYDSGPKKNWKIWGVSSHYGPVKMVNAGRAERFGFLNENNFAKLR